MYRKIIVPVLRTLPYILQASDMYCRYKATVVPTKIIPTCRQGSKNRGGKGEMEMGRSSKGSGTGPLSLHPIDLPALGSVQPVLLKPSPLCLGTCSHSRPPPQKVGGGREGDQRRRAESACASR